MRDLASGLDRVSGRLPSGLRIAGGFLLSGPFRGANVVNNLGFSMLRLGGRLRGHHKTASRRHAERDPEKTLRAVFCLARWRPARTQRQWRNSWTRTFERCLLRRAIHSCLSKALAPKRSS